MANGDVQSREESTVYVKEFYLFVTVMLLEETFAVLSLGELCQDHGYSYEWTSGQKHISPKMARELIAIYQAVYHSSSSSSQDSTSANRDLVSENRGVETPVPERSGSTSDELTENPLHESTETENQNENMESKEVQKRSIT